MILNLRSPDGRVAVDVLLQPHPPRDHRCLHYAVTYDGQAMLEPSLLGLWLAGLPPLMTNLEVLDVAQRESDTTWRPVCGERSTVRDRYREATVTLRETIPPRRVFQVAFRAYDEGVALRYTVPDQAALRRLVIERELTTFALPAGCRGYDTKWAQGRYGLKPITQIGSGCERPLVVTYPHGKWGAIGEAGNLDCARMKLRTRGSSDAMEAELSGQVVAQSPWSSPWRYVIVGDTPGQLIERNDLLPNLSPPSAIGDTSWVRPGKVIREVTLSTAGGRACVDFAVAHNLQHIEYDAGWYGPEDADESDARSVSIDPDRLAKIPDHKGLDLREVIAYASSRNIGVWLYVNRRALERQLDEILPLYQSWGVAGIKFGFVEVGAQGWTAWLHDAVRKCAEHRLMVDIHDEYRSTGIVRTLPNLLTVEGIHGNEEFPSPTHNVTLPFTRFVSGPADYTICYYDPRLKPRRSHQLAMAAVYYSPLQFLYWYDRPSAYGGEPEVEWFDRVPTIWDDTRVLAGEVGEFVSIARRSGDAWFVGSMTNEAARTLDLKLDFLESGRRYVAHIYRDPSQSDANPHAVAIERREVTAGDTLPAAMAGSGGHSVRIEPVK